MAYTSAQLKLKATQARARTEKPLSVIAPPANPKLQAFADAILTGASVSDAARAGGYHPGSAGALESDTVVDILKRARAEIEDVTTIKRLDVLNMFLDAVEMARTMADPANMINGADKIAKMMGYYAPETKRLELSMDHSALGHKLRALSDEELMDLASQTQVPKLIEGEVVS